MNRTFHTQVGGWYWLLMLVTAFLLFDFFWFHQTILTILCAIVMIFEIEMLIHTQYVLTSEGSVRIETGRFLANTTFAVDDIIRICGVKSMSVAPALSFRRLEIIYRSGNKEHKVLISPKNQEDFIRWIKKRRPDICLDIRF